LVISRDGSHSYPKQDPSLLYLSAIPQNKKTRQLMAAEGLPEQASWFQPLPPSLEGLASFAAT
jgi:hypothetical protein